jgi:hypothetical protein
MQMRYDKLNCFWCRIMTYYCELIRKHGIFFEDITHVQQFTIPNSMALSRWYLQARMVYIGDTQIKCTTAA